MDTDNILQDVLEESHLTKNGCLGTDVFFYLAGRHPELTIGQAVEVVQLARRKCTND